MATDIRLKNPQDATRRNVQAGNKRDKAMLERIRELEIQVKALWREYEALTKQRDGLK